MKSSTQVRPAPMASASWILYGVIALVGSLAACDTSPVVDGDTLADGRMRTFVHGAVGVASYSYEFAPGRFILIDTGDGVEENPVVAWLDQEGHGVGAVEQIFFTHGHPDHIGGALAFANATKLAMAEEVGIITGAEAPERPFPRFSDPEPTGVRVDRELIDGQRILLGPNAAGDGLLDVEVFHVPGHTPGSAAYLLDGVLFLGDTASARSDGTLNSATWLFSTDTDQSQNSLAALVDRLEHRPDAVQALAMSHSETLRGSIGPLADLVADRR